MELGFILFVCFCGFIAIQSFYYLIIFNGKFRENKIEKKGQEAVSVVICARNNRAGLENHLPLILAQDYPNFEVIVVNDGSTDGTYDYLEGMDQQHPNLKVLHLDIDERFHRGKKFAQTIGIKAAKNDRLLFTDTDCEPSSEHWISHMMAAYTNNTEIVLGVSNYKRSASPMNWLIQLETFHSAFLYINFAIKQRAYMGVGRNLSYSRELFFRVKGFAKHQHLISGDDDLFVNETATKTNVAVCVHPEARTLSETPGGFGGWYRQKMRHFSTGKMYKGMDKWRLGLYFTSMFAIYPLMAGLMFYSDWWIPTLVVFGYRLLTQAVVLHKNMKMLDYMPYFLLFPLMDFGILFIQIFVGIRGYFSKPLAW